MARKRRPTREEIERQAQAELERSMGRSLGSPRSPYASPSGPPSPPPPAWGPPPEQEVPERNRPPAWQQDAGPSDEADDFGRPSAADEEAAVTEFALQQWAERRGGGSLENHVVNRMQPSQAEAARDRALREALSRQQRFASPSKRMPVPQATRRGFANSWTTSSPAAGGEEPMAWEGAMSTGGSARRPARAAVDVDEEPARSVPAKKRAAGRKAGAKKAAAKKRTSGKKAPARKAATATKATAKKATAKKAATARKATAKKAPAKKAATARKATAKKAPAKKAATARKATAKKAATARKAPIRRAGATSRGRRG